MFKYFKKFCIVMILLLFFSCLPAPIWAAETPGSNIVTQIEALAPEILSQTIPVASDQEPQLPETVSVFLAQSEASVSLPVTWKAVSSFDKNKAGIYLFKMVLPAQYHLQEGVRLPEIKIVVEKLPTYISGLTRSFKKRSRTELSDVISVTPAFGRSISLQMYKNGKWVTKKTYKLKNAKTSTVKIMYPKDWWTLPTSKWRIYLPESKEGKSFTSSDVTITALKYYQNPSHYVQIQNRITLRHSGAYNLNVGYMGLKVQKVNRYFKIGDKYWPRYTKQTKAKVKAFQKKKKIKATGIVNKTTWLKMGFSSKSWSTLGAYVSPIKVNPSSTKKEHVEVMINTAKKYLGSNYVVGASGTPSQGADCSGLVIQALYAAGIDPYPISCVSHSKPGHEFESRNLWAYKKFKTVSYSKKKRGDLIFYTKHGGVVNHIAIYLGNGKVIESWPNKVVINPIKNSRRGKIKGVKRVFN